MNQAIRENKILAVLLALGLICALLLCGVRAIMEFQNTEVCVVMSTQDIATLDHKPENVREFNGNTLLDGVLLLVEDEVQYSYVNEYTPDAENWDGPMARCFLLYPQFAARYHDLGYPGAEEIENILYRAVTDRNVRVVWITPFTDAQTGRTITDAAVYEDVVENLSARIERHGLILSSSFSAFGAYEPSPLLIFAAYGVAAAGILLLGCFFRLSRRWEILLAVAGMGACAALWCAESLWGYNLFTPLLAFAASVIFPCLSLWYAYERLSALRRDTLSRTLGAYTGILLVSLGIAVAGGLFVGALQSGSDYLLAIANFRGVKLSQLLPLAFAVYAVLRFLCPPREILAGRKFILILGAFGLICGVGYYILRTGNAGVSVLEQRFRNWLELLLIARPRTKEFLVAWPCLAAAAVLVTKGKRAYSWPFAVLAASGYASAVNTFCHARSPLWLSLTRTLLGAALGAAIGLILIAITYSGPSVKKDAPET